MYSQLQKEEALKLYDEVGSVDRTIFILGYPTRRCLYGWIRERDEANAAKGIEVQPHRRGRKPLNGSTFVKPAPEMSAVDREAIDKLQTQLHQMQLAVDILQELIRLKQKKPVFDLENISLKEKAEIITTLRAKYPLHELLEAVEIDRSAYYYHHGSIERRASKENKG